jgi:hypothetical protein
MLIGSGTAARTGDLVGRCPAIEQRPVEQAVCALPGLARNRLEYWLARHREGVELCWIPGTGKLTRDADDSNSYAVLPPNVHCSSATGMVSPAIQYWLTAARGSHGAARTVTTRDRGGARPFAGWPDLIGGAYPSQGQ